ncbi:MAG: hypothetical protein HS111_07040 [Kofleriaceae bacterium]|nr:hypothetical protein [Kofleriaceae bacterium]
MRAAPCLPRSRSPPSRLAPSRLAPPRPPPARRAARWRWSRSSSTTPAAPPPLRLTRTAAGCRADLDGATADQAGPLVITVAGDTASAGAWRLGPGPAGRELRGEVGLVARVVAEPGRLSLVDPIGVPMVRLALTAERATAVDASRAPVGAVERHGDRHRLLAGPAGDTLAGTVSGTTDLELAARLLAPAPLPLPARALLACDRLAAVTPAAK